VTVDHPEQNRGPLRDGVMDFDDMGWLLLGSARPREDRSGAWLEACVPPIHPLERFLGSVDVKMSDAPLSPWARFVEALQSVARSMKVPGVVRTRRASWVLERKPSTLAVARRRVRAQIDEWRWSGHTEIIELLVTELVTNALRHAPGEPVLTLLKHGDTIRCEVQDDNPAFLRPQSYDSPGTSHGLLLVDLLSRSWGAIRTERGKIVWCEVSARGC
jgi:anti-sigma regulatory factor (Ser/Thr protein kinase)